MTTDKKTAPGVRFAPLLILAAGCLIAVLSWGPRSAAGAMQLPVIESFNISTEVYAFAFALQNLLWGFGQPFSGALADRFGATRVLAGGGLLYALGTALMPLSSSPTAFTITVGAIVGFGLSGCSLTLIIAAFGKLLPERMRPVAFGLASGAGSFGQFLFSPLAGGLIEAWGWQATSVFFGALLLAILPLSLILAAPQGGGAIKAVPFRDALSQALRNRSYLLIVIGFFTCGFQLSFITVHFQRYVIETGLSPAVGYWAFALVGLFNVIGSLASGWLCQRYPSRYVLAAIYFLRSLVALVFILLPPSPINAFAFGVLTGLLWLSTLAPTSTMVNVMFGPANFGMLYGVAFCSHQIGGFCGVLIGGVLRAWTGSYTATWWLSIALGVASALISLPIIERATPLRATPAPA